MAGFQLVGVMAMVCWLAAVTGTAKAGGEPGAGGSPVDGSGSDSEARDGAPVGSSEAAVPDSGVVPVEEASPAGSDSDVQAEAILRQAERDAEEDQRREKEERGGSQSAQPRRGAVRRLERLRERKQLTSNGATVLDGEKLRLSASERRSKLRCSP